MISVYSLNTGSCLVCVGRRPTRRMCVLRETKSFIYEHFCMLRAPSSVCTLPLTLCRRLQFHQCVIRLSRLGAPNFRTKTWLPALRVQRQTLPPPVNLTERRTTENIWYEVLLDLTAFGTFRSPALQWHPTAPLGELFRQRRFRFSTFRAFLTATRKFILGIKRTKICWPETVHPLPGRVRPSRLFPWSDEYLKDFRDRESAFPVYPRFFPNVHTGRPGGLLLIREHDEGRRATQAQTIVFFTV